MALPEDLDALCTQQLFRAAESSHLEELDDFDLVLSQTSDAELSLCTQGLALSPRDEKILLKPLPRPQLLSSTHKERCGLLRYVRELTPEINFFKDAQFSGFQRTLDGEMKRLRSCGFGSEKKQHAEPISVAEESILWKQGLLGSLSPQVLLDTMVFLCGMYFALQSGQEHCDLQFNQIEPPDNSPLYLVYTENTGGMAQRKLRPNQVMHHSNS